VFKVAAFRFIARVKTSLALLDYTVSITPSSSSHADTVHWRSNYR